MSKKILVVEDNFVEANNVRIILEKAGYEVPHLADSYSDATRFLEKEIVDFVLLDIFLSGRKTGIDLAQDLKRQGIAFIYLSANSNKDTLAAAKLTEPYGFLIKPFRERDVLVALDIADHIHQQKQKLKESAVIQESFSSKVTFDGIIGKSKKLMDVLKLVKIVAPTDTTVLICGESGTGKERIIDSIYHNSQRKSGPLIKVNCAALPTNLIETELFGHERGAFTGALERRIGRFEQAHNGTIVLDEIGELPIDLQGKLLRVLQEREVERIGGRGSVKVDVRIIVATNRSLEKEMAEGRFRIDLFYRLNVFPILLPPLRDRTDDIPLLVEHFVKYFCQLNNIPVKQISPEALNPLRNYQWPGNIRELEHLIERTVILTPQSTIDHIELPLLAEDQPLHPELKKMKSIKEMEIDYIKTVIESCNGRLSGPGGASEILDIPYRTLIAKLKKFRIELDKEFN
ncbi:sigma-54-dependent transcriptional regulator [Mucilaginibacter aquaedulcis]|uniref:sigma-54-dependent transcriptional regulator n=1 Tax=Mucilaginibacter aquaedulcis TaxID=1187081 RepID=UPI0025B42AEF|nr:sigma-54 dependent transcriptional regulator [Mucilaginibacter aquaedulcis]MDN3546750.1 sigma-54 dependent transcriptional regulator [Mucilaginibacter aquaedulcis]